MKLKQLKLRPSAVCMTEAEMKNVIGGIQSTSNELVCPEIVSSFLKVGLFRTDTL